ncbi:MAG TPA: hypothetical protein VFS39_05100 [Nitrospira sp.]|nr:hypothetical protein [Nitrospira sp.]
MESDEEFFAERARQERAAAKASNDRPKKKSHLELAEAYQELSAALKAAHQPSLRSPG